MNKSHEAPPQPAPEPTSGAAEPCSKIFPNRDCCKAPAPTPTDVSAAAREAAEGIERDLERNGRALFPNGKRDVISANIQALLSTQRATDRQRIAELEAALDRLARKFDEEIRKLTDGGFNGEDFSAYRLACKALLP